VSDKGYDTLFLEYSALKKGKGREKTFKTLNFREKEVRATIF
jgi:hypothetical protein